MQHRVNERSSTSRLRPSSPLRNKIQNTPGVPFLPSYLPIHPGRLILQNYRLENSAPVSKQVPAGAMAFQPEAQPPTPPGAPLHLPVGAADRMPRTRVTGGPPGPRREEAERWALWTRYAQLHLSVQLPDHHKEGDLIENPIRFKLFP